jgi:uncharacterized protein (DUF697 family)
MDKAKLEFIKKEVEALGGLKSFKSGDWLLKLVQNSFSAYYENATPEFFRSKYPGLSDEDIYKKLRKVAIRQSGLVGAGTGALISINELVALLSAGEGGIGLPGNIAAAFITAASELLIVTKIQLELVSRIARLYRVELNPNDPEDVWTILTVAIGGELAQEAGKFGVKIGGRLTGKAIKEYFGGETLAYAKRFAAKLGFKLLQSTVISAAVPIVSIASATLYNRALTGRIATMARKHFMAIASERAVQSLVVE